MVGEDRYTPEEMNEPSLAHLGLICLHLLCPAIWFPRLCLSVSELVLQCPLLVINLNDRSLLYWKAFRDLPLIDPSVLTMNTPQARLTSGLGLLGLII